MLDLATQTAHSSPEAGVSSISVRAPLRGRLRLSEQIARESFPAALATRARRLPAPPASQQGQLRNVNTPIEWGARPKNSLKLAAVFLVKRALFEYRHAM